MFSSPILEKGSRFPSLILGIGSVGSPVLYWKMVLLFPQSRTGKGSVGFPVQFWGNVLCVLKSITGKLF